MGHPRSYWLTGIAVMAGTVALAQPATAQNRRFDVAPQPAQSGIPLFAHQAGIQILVSGPVIDRVRVNRVEGSMEIAAALRMLLSGTDLVPVMTAKAIVLKRRSSAALHPVAYASRSHPVAVGMPQQAMSPAAAPQDADPAQDGADIVVTGIRRSLQESIEAKRAAGSIVDVITAQDIGKLPDQNVAESLSRVTGVQISRREGDGSTFTVRGISQNRLEINGRNYIGPGNGGGAALESISPEILSSIVVTKSPTADMPEGALGATVNLKTKRPLDLADLVIAGRLQGVHGDQADKLGYRGSALISKRFGDRFGLLASVAYSDTNTQGQSYDTGGWTRTNNIDGNGDGVADPNLFRPNRFMARVFDRAEQRLTVNGTAQWKPTDTLEIIADATFNHLKRQRNSVNYQVLFNDNDVDAVADENGTVVSGTFNGVTVRPLIYDEPTDLRSMTLGGTVKWENGPARVSFDMSYSSGEGSDGGPGASFTYVVVPRTGRTANASYNLGAGNPIPDLALNANFDVNDPRQYQLLSVFDYDSITSNSGYDARLDWGYDVEWGPISSIEAGVRYERVALFSADPQNLPVAASLLARGDGNGDGVLTIDELGGLSYADRSGSFFSGVDGAFPRDLLGGTMDKNAARDAFGLAVPDPYDRTITVGPGSIKDVTQDTMGMYAKANFAGSLGAIAYSGNAGLRYIDTLRESAGFLSNSIPTVSKSDFGYLLPSANLAFDFNDDLTLRLAAAKVVSRPSLNDVSVSFVPNTVSFTGSRGNPNLRPFEATQYDATLEWYFAPGSSITGALFYKKVDSFTIQTVTREFVPGFSDRFGLFDISQPSNGEDGTIKGFELAYQHAFRFLPAPFDNLGVQANYTYVDSSTPLIDSITGEALPLPGLSKDSYTLIGYYEDALLSARAAYTFRSEFLATVQGAASGGNRYNEGRGQLDASVQINITKNFRLTAEGINLTKELETAYLGVPNRIVQVSQEDRRVFFGIAASF